MAKKSYTTLEELLIMVNYILAELKSKGIINFYGLIGGLAVSAVTFPRATKNIDFLVSAENIERFYEEFKKQLIKKEFIIEFKKPEYDTFPFYAIICYEKHKNLRMIDILITALKWQDEICKNTVQVDFAGKSIPVVNTEGLIVLKLKSGGAMDIIDVQTILNSVNIKKLDLKKLTEWSKRAGVIKQLKKYLKYCVKKKT